MNKQTVLHLLVPSGHFPEEGAEPESYHGGQAPVSILQWFTRQSMPGEVAFDVGADGSIFFDSEPFIQFEHIRLAWEPGEADTPWVDPAPVSLTLSLRGVFNQDDEEPHYEGEELDPADALRGLLLRLQCALDDAMQAFRGRPLPVLEWIPGEEEGSGRAVLHGIWLAEPSEAAGLGGWRGDANTPGIIFEEADVEGRGVREMAAALLMMGIVVGGAPTAEAGRTKEPAQQEQSGGLLDKLKRVFKHDQEKAPQPETKSAPTKKVTKQVEKKVTTTASTKKVTTAKTTTEKKQTPKQAPATMDQDLLKEASADNVQVVVEIGKQRAYLIVDGKVALDTPISSASKGRWTPRGSFTISQRVRTGKMSTIYKCPLPCWMRLGETAVGMHVGDLPGYPASHGCIRLPKEIAPVIFDHTFKGTNVQVVDTWTPPAAQQSEQIAQAKPVQDGDLVAGR